MRRWLIIACLFTVAFSLVGNESAKYKEMVTEKMNQCPRYLYKILSLSNWQATQDKKTVHLSPEDDVFIHLATEDQLERIIKKYWADVPQFVILKVDSSKLEGELKFEANVGGTNKYYHLYKGVIPVSSILESRIVYQKN